MDCSTAARSAVTAPTVTIGGSPSGNAGEFWVDPASFRQGGFASYNLTGINDLEIASGTQIRPQMQNWIPDASYLIQAHGDRYFVFQSHRYAGRVVSQSGEPDACLDQRIESPGIGQPDHGSGRVHYHGPGRFSHTVRAGKPEVFGTIDAPRDTSACESRPGWSWARMTLPAAKVS